MAAVLNGWKSVERDGNKFFVSFANLHKKKYFQYSVKLGTITATNKGKGRQVLKLINIDEAKPNFPKINWRIIPTVYFNLKLINSVKKKRETKDGWLWEENWLTEIDFKKKMKKKMIWTKPKFG